MGGVAPPPQYVLEKVNNSIPPYTAKLYRLEPKLITSTLKINSILIPIVFLLIQ
jgi:hypothetical protein